MVYYCILSVSTKKKVQTGRQTFALHAELHYNCVCFVYYVSQQSLRQAAVKRLCYDPTVTFADLAFVLIAVVGLAGSDLQQSKCILGTRQRVNDRNRYYKR